MILFNERGDEVGGLTVHGHLDEAGSIACGGVTSDRFHQDHVARLRSRETGASRAAGIHVSDRHSKVPIDEFADAQDKRYGCGPGFDRRGDPRAGFPGNQCQLNPLQERGLCGLASVSGPGGTGPDPAHD